jgi:hypothetical protein
VKKLSWLRDGSKLIKTKNVKHVSDEEFLEEIKSQNIVGIQRIKKKVNGAEVESGVYFLTFSTCEPPEEIKLCYELVPVREFVSSPMRCWNCLGFCHTKKHCENDTCTLPTKCVNCSGNHSSIDRNCATYLMHKEINAIMVYEKVTMKEAPRQIYRQRNPEMSYARIVSQNASNEQPPQSSEIQELRQQIQQLKQQLQQQLQQNAMLQQQIQQLLQQQVSPIKEVQTTSHKFVQPSTPQIEPSTPVTLKLQAIIEKI